MGHSAAVTCAVFSAHNPHEVITVSEDRTFKVVSSVEITLYGGGGGCFRRVKLKKSGAVELNSCVARHLGC